MRARKGSGGTEPCAGYELWEYHIVRKTLSLQLATDNEEDHLTPDDVASIAKYRETVGHVTPVPLRAYTRADHLDGIDAGDILRFERFLRGLQLFDDWEIRVVVVRASGKSRRHYANKLDMTARRHFENAWRRLDRKMERPSFSYSFRAAYTSALNLLKTQSVSPNSLVVEEPIKANFIFGLENFNNVGDADEQKRTTPVHAQGCGALSI